MSDFFAELGGGETGPSGKGPGGELDLQAASHFTSRTQVTARAEQATRTLSLGTVITNGFGTQGSPMNHKRFAQMEAFNPKHKYRVGSSSVPFVWWSTG